MALSRFFFMVTRIERRRNPAMRVADAEGLGAMNA
jgi:hypothetical protein